MAKNRNLRLWHLLLPALGSLSGWAYAASPPLSKVPFVGCPLLSMGTPVAAPHRAPRIVAVKASLAARIAYYAGASQYWPGAYAPRGWHCRVWSGANGSFMVVTPEPPPDVTPHASVTGPGVFASISIGGTGGRFDVAQVGARFFPQALRAFIQKVRTGDADLPAAHFVVKPYPDDIATQVGNRMIEFTTPAFHEGFGTSGAYPIFMVSDQAVRGLVAFSVKPPAASPTWPNLQEYEIRLPKKERSLAMPLIQLEEQCLKDRLGC